PAVSGGGLDYVYASPTRATIPSTGQKLKVPLATETYPVETRYQATPSLATTAFLAATVQNKSDRPVLLGPATIFSGDELAGEGPLATTGPGGTIDFPLGADEDVKLLRTVIPSTDTKGFISKDDVTTYKVKIEIGNYKKRPIKMVVLEPLPRSRNKEIEVEL